jgi:hypothetical protein
MSLVNLFSYADSLFRSLAKNPPGGDWSVVVLASLSYPWSDEAASGELQRGRMEYSPGRLIRFGEFEYLEPPSFSGDIPAAVGDPTEVSFAPAAVTVTAPTSFASNYSIEAAITGWPEQSASVPDQPPSVITAQGTVSVSWPGQAAQSNLVFWGFPYQYPFIVPKL